MQPFSHKALTQAIASNNVDQLEEAREICHVMLKAKPNSTAFLYLMGVIERKLGHADLALKWIEKALLIMPNSAELHCSYAQTLAVQKKHSEAVIAFIHAIALKPDYAEAYFNLGNILNECGDDVNAIEAYKHALTINPNFPEALNNLGVMLKNKGALVEAANCYNRALTAKPDNPLTLDNLGVIYFSLGNLDAAADYHHRALALKPDYPSALNNLGMILRHQGALAESISLLKKALALQPNFPEAFNNLGNALKDCGKLQEAIVAYEQAIALKDDYPDFHNNLAMALLAAGRFEEGWRKYEWRWKSTQLAAARQDVAKPLWQGDTTDSRILLIRAEQGFGDTLQFCRYAPLAAARGLRVILEVQPALVRLMESLAGVEQVIAQSDPLPDFDLYCPMMSLPAAFNTRLDTIPTATPYLAVKDEAVNRWRNRLLNGNDKMFKVGLVWAGQSRTCSTDLAATNRRRSISPDLLAPIMDIAGIQFYSLQKGGPAAPKEFGMIDLMDKCSDFADTAALIANLDLVISVDTAVAHLAGALGKQVWVLNRFDSCWRWLRNREDSPWYPTLRLFRQPHPGNWESVVSRIRKELKQVVDESVKQPSSFNYFCQDFSQSLEWESD